MIPITKTSEVICKNCIWGTQDTYSSDKETIFCEVWQWTYSIKYYCCEGMFPAEISQKLHILPFEEAMKQLS